MDAHVRDLRAFVAVAEELHFTRAAERLFVSQPALSKQIRRFERTMRVELLERDRRGVSLTAAGHALLPHARRLVEDWEEARRATLAAASEGALTVGVATSVGRGVLFGATRRFTDEHPAARVEIRQVAWSDPTAGLADATSDVALVWLPVPGENIEFEVLISEPRWVALPADHPLADHERIAFDDLLDEPFLALPGSAGELRDFWLAVDHRRGRPVRIGRECANADETLESVASGLGVALIAAGNADLYRRDGTTARPVDGVMPARLAVAWRSDDARPVVASFVAACRAAHD
jgi:DNA-binding transcriptional LysR family regulator